MEATPAGTRAIGPGPRRWAIGLATGAAVLALGTAAFPWGLLRPIVQSRLAASLGRPVTIAGMSRVDAISFVPTVELSGVRIAQPAWARVGAGNMAEIARVRVRFPVLPLLIGRFQPRAIDLAGARIALVRDANGRSNWEGDDADKSGGSSSPPSLAHLTIADSRIALADAKRHLTLDATLASDTAHGLVVAGRGTHRGQPLRLALHGAALGAVDPGKPYDVQVAVRSPLVSLKAAARLDHVLDTDHFTARIATTARDLEYLDDLLQAGLFPTQPIDLAGTLRHDGKDWRIERLHGRIGRSRVTTSLTVTKRDGRTRIDGAVDADTLDFDDLASDRQRAEGAAKARATGPRVLPDTRIRFDKLGHLDGTVRLNVKRLLSREESPFRSLRTTATMERRRLILSPLAVGLNDGTLSGRIVANHRGQTPRLTLDLAVNGARIESLVFPKGEIRGPLRAHIRLAGSGDTVQAAIGRSSGKVGIVVRGGTVRRDYATFLGGDLVKSVGALVGGGDARAAVRCLIVDMPARGGVLTPAPLALDTEVAGATGSGRITLADERIDLRLAGRAAKPGAIQSTAPMLVFGTLSTPKLDIRPPRAERPGKTGVFDRIGFFIKGLRTKGDAGRARAAVPLDCAGLARKALG